MANTKTKIVEDIKELLSDPKNRIKLDDYVTKHLKAFLSATSIEQFPVQDLDVQKENFLERLEKYEQLVKDLQQIVILIARWGNVEQLSVLAKIFGRLAEADKGSSGLDLWLNFGWYPIQILMYSAGIAALSAENYDALRIVLTTAVQKSSVEREYCPLVVIVGSHLSDTHAAFKLIPGQERSYTPRSEHLLQILEPTLQKLLFIGKSYERLFDGFEVFSALIYADATGRQWAPIGRFGWKYCRGFGDNPVRRLTEEAKERKGEWPLLPVGLFGGSLERFLEASKALEQLLSKLSWW